MPASFSTSDPATRPKTTKILPSPKIASSPLARLRGNVMKMRSLTGALVSTLALAAAVSANAQSRYLGPDVGIYFPSSSTLRDALGDSWFSIGATTVRSGVQQSRGIGTNWNVISKSSGGNKVFMGSYSIGLAQPLSGPGASARPYFALRGGLSYIDYAIGPSNNRTSGKRLGYNVNAEIGILFNDRLSLSARYDVFSEHDNLNFDGLSLNLKYALVKF